MVLCSFLNTFVNSRNECRQAYNFVISKIEITPTSTLEFYNNKEKIVLWNFIIPENEGVEVGDLLYKEKCSKYLYIYKKNDKGEYVVHLKVNSSGIFPCECFCN